MSGIYKLKRTLQYNKRESEVLKLILKHPGVRYKQVQRIIGLPNGSLIYILKKLEGSRRITVNRADNATAYYSKDIKTDELHFIENLRNNIDRKIVQYLLDQGQSTFYDIVNHSIRAPSTVSWHLSRLKNRKLIISISHHDELQAYKIINKKTVAKMLSKHKKNLFN